jgi:predicted amidophosphoribosyltransferase
MTDERRCPACRTPWRAAVLCPRCGADLGPLMRLAARAWTLRETARAALLAGDNATALAQARAAYALERTQQAQRLLALALVAIGDAAGARGLIAEATAS